MVFFIFGDGDDGPGSADFLDASSKGPFSVGDVNSSAPPPPPAAAVIGSLCFADLPPMTPSLDFRVSEETGEGTASGSVDSDDAGGG